MPDFGGSHVRPLVTAVVSAAFGVHDVGTGATIFAKAPAGTLTAVPRGAHEATSTGTLAFVGKTPHVASMLSESAKVPVLQPPPTSEHVHVHVGVPSPPMTRRSLAVSEAGQLGRDVGAKFTGVQPAGGV